jgi:hypothetical protein
MLQERATGIEEQEEKEEERKTGLLEMVTVRVITKTRTVQLQTTGKAEVILGLN